MAQPSPCSVQTANSSNSGAVRLGTGRAVVLYERIRFVRALPSSSQPISGGNGSTPRNNGTTASTQSSPQWWPAIVYESYAELMRDVDPRDIRTRTWLLLRHRSNPKTPVAHLLGTRPPGIRPLPGESIADNEANHDDLCDFFDHLEEIHRSTTSPQIGNGLGQAFEDAMNVAYGILESGALDEGPSPLQMVESVPPPPPSPPQPQYQPPQPLAVASTPKIESANESPDNDYSKETVTKSAYVARNITQQESRVKDETTKRTKKKKDDESLTGKSSPVAPKVKGTPIQHSDTWEIVWDKLRYSGWSWKAGSGLMMDYYYIKPGKNVKTGIEGKDYFTRKEDVEAFVEDNYAWSVGARGRRDHSESRVAAGSSRDNGNRRSSRDRSSYPPESKKKTSSNRRSSGVPRKINTESSSRSRSKQRGSKNAVNSSEDRIWGKPSRKEKEKRKRTSSADEPSSKRRSKNSKYTKTEKGSTTVTPANRTKPQDPAIPLSYSPDQSCSSLDSQTKNNMGSSFSLSGWIVLWERLTKAGWMVVQAPAKDLEHDYFWVRPGRDVRSKHSKLGIDYFSSPQEVFEYQRREDEADSNGGKEKRKRKHQSAVSGDFEREAMAAKGDDTSSVFSASTLSSRAGRKNSSSALSSSAWWRKYTVPAFLDIWPTLQSKLNFYYKGGYYYKPDGKACKEGGIINRDFFDSPEAMRKYLCRVGVPNLHNLSADIGAEKKENDEVRYLLISRWVSTAFLPPKAQHFEDAPLLTSKEAWKILRAKLGCNEVKGVYNLSISVIGKRRGSSEKIKQFSTLDEVRAYLRGHGLHSLSAMEYRSRGGKSKNHEDKSINDEEILALSLWASLSPLPTYRSSIQSTPVDRLSTMSSVPVVTTQGKSNRDDVSPLSPFSNCLSSSSDKNTPAVQAALNAESSTPNISGSMG